MTKEVQGEGEAIVKGEETIGIEARNETGKTATKPTADNIEEEATATATATSETVKATVISETTTTEIEDKAPTIETTTKKEKTEVLLGVEGVTKTILKFMGNTKTKYDTFFDKNGTSMLVEEEQFRNAIRNALTKRGIKVRTITEINQYNLQHCKEYMKMITELRHLGGIKSGGAFAVNEDEYISTSMQQLHEVKPSPQIIYSNVKGIVEQHQYLFDTLWDKAMPADQRIKQIEEGVEPTETKVLTNADEIVDQVILLAEKSQNEIFVVSSGGGMQLIHKNKKFFDQYKKVLDRQRRGEHKGIRWITNINKKDDVYDVAKIFLALGMQIRHMVNLPPMNFVIADKKMINATIEKMEGGKMVQNLLTSNEPLYVNHFYSIFEDLWANGEDARHRINAIEKGLSEQEFLDVITDPNKACNVILDLVESVTKEALFFLPNDKALVRVDKLGIIDRLIKSSKQNDIVVKIICPLTERNSNIIKKIHENASEIRVLDGSNSTSMMFITDSTKFLRIELSEPEAESFVESIGHFAIYSNSKLSVESFKSVFDLLWKERLLNEDLKEADRMQKDFINVTAHELRTPLQPILGLCEILSTGYGKGKGKEEENMLSLQENLDSIHRNAKRLYRLVENILNVAKIEGQRLHLNKDLVNLKEIISTSIAGYKDYDINRSKTSGANSPGVGLLFDFAEVHNHYGDGNDLNDKKEGDEQCIFVEADKDRISQVLDNLINNAFKFTKHGSITFSLKVENNEAIVSIKDTGAGIDPQIMKNLFAKFATTSISGGTGLGLYISKSIIDSHGGRIWAENNSNGKGAKFSFSLPVRSKENIK